MSWFDTAIEVDAKAAAAIYQGMHDVALADGHVHERELEVIESFRSDIPSDAFPADASAIQGAELGSVYLRSLIMVALADGVITDAEQSAIQRLAGEAGLDKDAVATTTRDVKKLFIGQFKGVKHFRESVERVAKDLGLEDDEVQALFA